MPPVLRLGLGLLRAPALELGFLLRSRLCWSRGEAPLVDEAKHGLFEAAPAQALAARLGRDFELGPLTARSTRTILRSNLARLDGLLRLADGLQLPAGADGTVRAADFGCGDFHYATALQRWLAHHGGGRRQVVLRGFELDGYGLYRDGHSRADHARAHARLAGDGVSFAVADCTALRLPPQDVVSLFFPFLSVYACLAWGTPLSRLRPRRLLRRAVASLRPGGWLVVVDQTAAEFARLERLLGELPVRRQRTAPFASELAPEPERTAGQVASIWVRC
ncbi:MAG: hypothetical protein IT455_05745 [Planctomycetes bacterium]|nr:hypothetical protein [Planctomycetota bacterium]